MQFGLFFFAATGSTSAAAGYDLLLSCARFADENDFTAVWTPERHFHGFGGLYPNPSVLGAALAVRTRRVAIRAGSVVMPLHHPIRVAEEWSVVDNLSGGRVGVSFASGWQRGDFTLARQPYSERHQVFWEGVEAVRALWRGEPVAFVDAEGEESLPKVFPPPIQRELPTWITTAGSAETAVSAGKAGANLLTHLLGQSIDELRDTVAAYRGARSSGVGPGHVTLMLHTFVHEGEGEAERLATEPLKGYLRSSFGLSAASLARLGVDVPTGELSPDDWDVLLGFAARRYMASDSLIGTPARCRELVERLAAVGVDEIACLVDFGLEDADVLAGLGTLARCLT
ncbi:MupA/Atu3671 family FMN-dependent luciferase-like monooxygenase [Rhizohabitans arisaemae]|uniref:MupA/Atu3671 family FMN-dependent luciferase-like monooxygenase n=1 Tax=Rhizohabitans arisaemae TaxID=2720610 RepID=UPI0024B12F97|nr:MupA/Atu3671 family FMN-dependent luciferase-like monooxygenase [Rhizohabitans arisaemae]